MKRFYASALLWLFIAVPVFAQKSFKLTMADRYFENLQYMDAIPNYEDLLVQTPGDLHVTQNLAECYRKINDPENAAKYYALVVGDASADPINQLYYALALSELKQYNEAQKWYQTYAASAPATDKRGKRYTDAYNDMTPFFIDSSLYKLTPMNFNSEYADFSPAYYKNGLIFCSGRKQQYIIKNTYKWDNTSYLELYYVEDDSVRSFNNYINTRFHEGPVTFTPDQDTIYFTRNNMAGIKADKSDDGAIKLKIFYANSDSMGNWDEIKSFPYNSDEYSTGHPTLTADGLTMYFISDKPGGYGGPDLYKTKWNGTKWGDPENLGPRINTAGSEMFPFVDRENNLYFASDGHAGLGGLDIFQAPFENGIFQDPINIGYPVNSNRDDFGYVYNVEELDGYFTSNRAGGKGSDDIYHFRKDYQRSVVYVYDSRTLETIAEAEVKIEVDGENLKTIKTADDRTDQLVVMPNRVYSFDVKKDLYYPNKITLQPDQLSGLDTIKIPLEQIVFAVKGWTFKEMNGLPLPGTVVKLTNRTTGTVIDEIITASDGKYFIDLEANTDYEISAAHPTLDCNEFIEKITTKGLTKSDTLEANFGYFCVGDVIKIDNINFDLDKSDIRPDAATELDKVVAIMNKYPTMSIEMRSHTDSQGYAWYNEALSDRRAKSSMQYLVSKGIVDKRLAAKGYGETEILNQCVDNVRCTPAEHAVNRRTEFKVISLRKSW